MNQYTNTLQSPLGPITVSVDAEGRLTALSFGEARGEVHPERTEHIEAQLREYFAGKRQAFDLPLAPQGTAFQRSVWDALVAIPFGETRTYGQLARDLGRPNAARAVGRANATNPIALIIPCHRVVGRDGALTGFAYGIDIKRQLLDFERSE